VKTLFSQIFLERSHNTKTFSSELRGWVGKKVNFKKKEEKKKNKTKKKK
jgi:hypothetical protein